MLTVDSQHPDELRVNLNAIEVGEFRGFSKNGREVFYVGYPFESSNIDLFAADLLTGRVRRLTSNPEYADPIDASPDDKWIVVEDTEALIARCLSQPCAVFPRLPTLLPQAPSPRSEIMGSVDSFSLFSSIDMAIAAPTKGNNSMLAMGSPAAQAIPTGTPWLIRAGPPMGQVLSTGKRW